MDKEQNEKVLDEFELHLEKMIKELQECQHKKNLNSCSPCELFFECQLRKDYVDAVYNSMSKGQTGGFEF